MSDRPPPGAAEEPPVPRPEVLTPEAIEHILADFRSWLEQVAQSAEAGQTLPIRDEDLEPIDLHTLLGQLTALRQEVHLQTRAVRAQQEQNAQTLEQLSSALASLHDTPAGEAEAGTGEDDLLRPLLKTLVDLYDALGLAAREVRRVQEAVQTSLDKAPCPPERADGEQPALELLHQWEAARERARRHGSEAPGWLARWLGVSPAQQEALTAERDAAGRVIAALREGLSRPVHQGPALNDQVRQMLDSLITGYTMSLQRVERALRQHELEPIPCVGQPFDPERMEVLEVATGTGRSSGEVIEEIRRGYLWRGRVFRYAQVRVAKS